MRHTSYLSGNGFAKAALACAPTGVHCAAHPATLCKHICHSSTHRPHASARKAAPEDALTLKAQAPGLIASAVAKRIPQIQILTSNPHLSDSDRSGYRLILSLAQCFGVRGHPKNCWTESREEQTARLERCADFINKNCDAGGLCKGLPQRVRDLVKAEGGRLPK